MKHIIKLRKSPSYKELERFDEEGESAACQQYCPPFHAGEGDAEEKADGNECDHIRKDPCR